jgi:hypothetical protein
MHEKFLFILERKSEKSRAPQCLAPFASQTPIGDTKRAKLPRNSGVVAPGLEEKPILPLPDWMAVYRELKRRARKAIRRAARRAPASSVSVIP